MAIRSCTTRARRAWLLAGLAACALLAPAAGATPAGATAAAGATPAASATLEQCLTSPVQAERSATFGGEMSMIPRATRMEMRIDVLERMPSEAAFHTVLAPGLGVWRAAAPGVRIFKSLKQVTNLSAPATYRGAVGFRWLGARGRVLRTLELRTQKCVQAALQPSPAPASSAQAPESSSLGGKA